MKFSKIFATISTLVDGDYVDTTHATPISTYPIAVRRVAGPAERIQKLCRHGQDWLDKFQAGTKYFTHNTQHLATICNKMEKKLEKKCADLTWHEESIKKQKKIEKQQKKEAKREKKENKNKNKNKSRKRRDVEDEDVVNEDSSDYDYFDIESMMTARGQTTPSGIINKIARGMTKWIEDHLYNCKNKEGHLRRVQKRILERYENQYAKVVANL